MTLSKTSSRLVGSGISAGSSVPVAIAYRYTSLLDLGSRSGKVPSITHCNNSSYLVRSLIMLYQSHNLIWTDLQNHADLDCRRSRAFFQSPRLIRFAASAHTREQYCLLGRSVVNSFPHTPHSTILDTFPLFPMRLDLFDFIFPLQLIAAVPAGAMLQEPYKHVPGIEMIISPSVYIPASLCP